MSLLRLIPSYYNEYLYLDPLMSSIGTASPSIHFNWYQWRQRVALTLPTLFSFHIISLFQANMFLFQCQFSRKVRSGFWRLRHTPSLPPSLQLHGIWYKYLTLAQIPLYPLLPSIYRESQNSVSRYTGLDIRITMLWIWCEWDAAIWSGLVKTQLLRSKQLIH